MKKLVLTGVAICAFALGAFAQGSINVDNNVLNNPYVDLLTLGSHYSGPATAEVWLLNAAAVPADLAGVNGSIGGGNPYAQLAADGFTMQKSIQGTASAGVISFGEVDMPGVTPKGGSVVLALAVWDSHGASWSGNGGMAVFVNPTADYTIAPPSTPLPANLTGWDALNSSLVMTAVPEPSTIVLAGLGAAALLIFRRRK